MQFERLSGTAIVDGNVPVVLLLLLLLFVLILLTLRWWWFTTGLPWCAGLPLATPLTNESLEPVRCGDAVTAMLGFVGSWLWLTMPLLGTIVVEPLIGGRLSLFTWLCPDDHEKTNKCQTYSQLWSHNNIQLIDEWQLSNSSHMNN